MKLSELEEFEVGQIDLCELCVYRLYGGSREKAILRGKSKKYMYISSRSILHGSVDVRVLGILLKYLWARKQAGGLGEKYYPRYSQT